MSLPTDAKARKAIPVYSGFVAYFPRGMCAVAELSMIANEQHNPGEPLHWAKEKSTDEKDALMRHLVDPLTNGGDLYDADRILHATKKAWRAMADLERLLDTGVPTLRPDPEKPVAEQIDDLCGIPDVMRSCTCPPGEAPVPCQGKFALSECVRAYMCASAARAASHVLQADAGEKQCAHCDEPLDIAVPRCTAREGGNVGPRCVLSDGHPGGHKSPGPVPEFEAYQPRPNPHCSDCGADLREGFHDARCLRAPGNQQHY